MEERCAALEGENKALRDSGVGEGGGKSKAFNC